MAWEVYAGGVPSPSSGAQLTIRSDGALYLNAVADKSWFAEAEVASLLLNRDLPGLAIAPGDRGGQTYQLSRASDHGADLFGSAALSRLGIDDEVYAEATRVPLDWDDEIEAAVADLSSLVDGADAADETTAPSTGEPDSDAVDEADDEAVEAAVETVEATDDRGDDADERWHPRERLATWVREKVADGHEYMFEAREIAEELPLSGQQVGIYLGQLRDETDDLAIGYVEPDGDTATNRARWRLSLADTDEDSATESARRFGPDNHTPAVDEPDDDVDAGEDRDVTDETYREVAQACSDIEAFARMFDDMSTVEALRIDRRLGLGLDGARYGGVRNGDGGESA